ncbi:hypothetical protein F2P81_012837 [Scophthalmus maximus]|uniref:Uncharacterized protein n=1 Tax=Scophthalmus maximus TaxID=52904 RepID=A0A6A4SQX1_SCOMX|nr:hypothetical protein F2P81_012837 [Scophthalmus maximus]
MTDGDELHDRLKEEPESSLGHMVMKRVTPHNFPDRGRHAEVGAEHLSYLQLLTDQRVQVVLGKCFREQTVVRGKRVVFVPDTSHGWSSVVNRIVSFVVFPV